MLQVNEATQNAYRSGNLIKNLTISFPDAHVSYGMNDIVAESLRLDETINSDTNLTFKGCICSQFSFKCSASMQDLRSQRVEVVLRGNGDDIQDIPLFKGFADKQTNLSHEDEITEITAYDVLYKLRDLDVSDWYEALTFPLTVKAFRDSLFQHLQLQQETTILPNDSLSLEKSIFTETVNALDLLKWICQVNARFGHIGRDGNFHYIALEEVTGALYPADDLYPSDTLYPSDGETNIFLRAAEYRRVSHEPFRVNKITYVKIFDSKGNALGYGANENNVLCITDNPIAYGVNQVTAATNIYNEIKNLDYDPASVDCVGLPYLEVGDSVIINTDKYLVKTFILRRTLSGIQALKDQLTADGEEYQTQYKEDADSTKLAQERHDRIESDAGIVTELETTAGQIRAEVSDAVNGLDSRITVNSNAISAEVTRATGAESGLSTRITTTADGLSAEITNRQNADSSLSTSIEANATAISTEVTNRTNADSGLSTRITQNATAISTEVTNRTNADSGLSSRITQNATDISTLTTKTGINSLGTSETLYSKITQNATSISNEVTRATTAEGKKLDKTTAIQSVSDILTDSQNKANTAETNAKNASIARTATYQTADSIVSAAVSQAGTAAGNTYIAKTATYQTADSIVSAAVTQAGTAAGNAYIAKTTTYQTADSIRLTAETNANTYTDQHAYAKQSYIDISANSVKIKSGGTFSVDSGNFSIDTSGNVSLKGAITASSGSIGGFTIDGTSIRSAALTSNANGSVGISTANFTRTIGDASRSSLRFAIGSKFAVSSTGIVYANEIYADSGRIAAFKLTTDGFTHTDLGHTYDVLRCTGELAYALGDTNCIMNIKGTVKFNGTSVRWREIHDAMSNNDYVLVEA